jgi:hypothetical protein
MRHLGSNVRELLAEQRLLRQVVALARRCDRCPSTRLLDDVLAGSGRVRPRMPAQRESGS